MKMKQREILNAIALDFARDRQEQDEYLNAKIEQIKQATKDIYILYQATKPAVMVECGFLSNAAEADKLTDEEYQDQIAFSICTALMNCLADQS